MAPIKATWTQLASSERLQRSSHTVSVIDNRVYIFGGELLPREPVHNQLDIVELSNGHTSIQEAADAHLVTKNQKTPKPRVGATSTVLNGIIYLFSGRGGAHMKPIDENGTLWSYNPSDSQWTRISPSDDVGFVPVARSYHTMTNDGKTKIYIHAGCPLHGRAGDLWSYDISTHMWRRLESAPGPERGGTSMAYAGGHIFRMNGFDGNTELGGNLDIFDPANNEWSTITYPADGENGPGPRSVGALLSVRINGKYMLVTVFGEHDPSSLGHEGAGKMLGDAWAFDIVGRKWNKVACAGETPQARGWFDADVVRAEAGNDAIVVHGGLAEDNSRLGDLWILKFNPEFER